ncbi:MAG: hypothetical protein HY395_02325 [Candidatus Doudnabacteria bacterium]|nr:hypothetical protein [Candidatus Doudnabacteria bacterium]
MSIRLLRIQVQSLETRLGRYWDERLLQEQPFAPSAVTVADYNEANENYVQFATTWLLQFAIGTVVVAGRGTDQEERLWILQGLRCGLKPVIVDASYIANLQARLNLIRMLGQTTQVQEMLWRDEVGAFLRRNRKRLKPPLTLYFSRFLSSQSHRNLKRILQAAGWYLSGDADPRSENRVILLHPFAEDNPEVKWVRTHPYSRQTILDNLRRGAGRQLRVTEKGNFLYFKYKHLTAWVVKAK